MDSLTLYSDGSSNGKKGGVAGYGWVLTLNDELLACGYGSLQNSTNNLAEVAGATEGLTFIYNKSLNKCSTIFLVSDSQYVLGFAQGITKAKVNIEETNRLTDVSKLLKVTTRWIRGHGIKQGVEWTTHSLDTLYNHWADKLSVYARKNILDHATHFMLPSLKEEMKHAFDAK